MILFTDIDSGKEIFRCDTGYVPPVDAIIRLLGDPYLVRLVSFQIHDVKESLGIFHAEMTAKVVLESLWR